MIVRLLTILLLLALSATLINSNIYGDSSLTALFTFWSLSSLSAFCICVFLFLRKSPVFLSLPKYFIPILGLTLYVCLHRLIFPSSDLSGFYWVSISLYLLSIYQLTFSQSKSKQQIYSFKLFIHSGITFIAGIEALIVFLQYFHIVPVPNLLFRCTGSWANPNISAMFLALSLFSIFYSYKNISSKIKVIILIAFLVITIIAILLLGSRTAFLVSAVIIIFEVSPSLLIIANKFLGINRRRFNYTMITIVMSLFLAITIFTKEESSASRIRVFINSFDLIVKQPILGYGFGQFEREYNLFAASKKNANNEHVNMAYNDFMEITIEGGIIGLLIWIAFLVTLFKHCKQNQQKHLYPILLSFLIIQFTNFGFQAIPVVILFVTIIGIETVNAGYDFENTRKLFSIPTKFLSYTSLVIIMGCCLLDFVKISKLSSAFYQKNILSKTAFGAERVNKLLILSKELETYASYQESLGDAFLQASNYQNAIPRYLLAIEKTSIPAVYSKIGFCYQKLNQFDNSQKVYSIVQNMEPLKLSPHLALLNLYHQKRDTINLIAEARIITDMRVKIQNKRSVEIKNYADSILKSMSSSNNLKIEKTVL